MSHSLNDCFRTCFFFLSLVWLESQATRVVTSFQRRCTQLAGGPTSVTRVGSYCHQPQLSTLTQLFYPPTSLEDPWGGKTGSTCETLSRASLAIAGGLGQIISYKVTHYVIQSFTTLAMECRRSVSSQTSFDELYDIVRISSTRS